MNYLRPELLDALARDYATGTLSGGARRRFERLLRERPVAAVAAASWQERMAVLAAGSPPVAPRPEVWAGLQRRLFAPRHEAASGEAAKREPWWRLLFGGRSLGGALAGLVLAVVVLQQQPTWLGHETYRDALPASYVGLLTDSGGKPTVLASSRRHGRALTVKMLQPVAAPAGRVAQLWALPKGGGAPVPIGVVPEKGSATLPLTDTSEKLFFTVDRLAVSFEPSAMPAGAAPSQPFVLSGHCVKLW